MLHLQNSPPHFLSGPKKLDLIKSAAATRVFPHRVGEETGREKKYSPSPLFPSFSLLFPLEPCLSGEKLYLPSRSHEPKRGERKIPWLYARTTQFPEKKGKEKKENPPPLRSTLLYVCVYEKKSSSHDFIFCHFPFSPCVFVVVQTRRGGRKFWQFSKRRRERRICAKSCPVPNSRL